MAYYPRSIIGLTSGAITMSGSVSYLAWRVSNRVYSVWHLCRDAKYTLCGRIPKPPLSIWQRVGMPPVGKQCLTCRERWVREGEIR